MKILVLNCGSSSLKYQLIDMETEAVLTSGKYERIGEKEAFITHKAKGKKVTIEHTAMDHTEAIDFTLKQFTNPEYKVIDSLDEITAIGHRLPHGGEKIAESVLIDGHRYNLHITLHGQTPLPAPSLQTRSHVSVQATTLGQGQSAKSRSLAGTAPFQAYVCHIGYLHAERSAVCPCEALPDPEQSAHQPRRDRAF